ncbi:sulfotransferase [Dokdonella sp.]|uniref:sulfotransferase n=4 Tax=Dokdonella sp. TaxID=2291710 RepID=UPI003BB1B550
MLQRAFEAYQSGNPRQAETLCREFLASKPEDQVAMLVLAMSLDAQHRTIEAIQLFERLTVLSPEQAENWANLGTVLRAAGQVAKAEQAFRSALDRDGGDANSLFNLGSLSFDKGDYGEARRFLLRALETAPDDPSIRTLAIAACFECADFEQTDRLLVDWERWATGNVEVLTDLGWTLTRLTRAEEAGRALEMAAQMMPNNTRVDLRRAAFYERTNRVAESRALLQQIPQEALDRVGLGTDATILRADLAARGDDLEGARHLYEKLVVDADLVRRDPQLPSQLARVCDRLDDPAAAMMWLVHGRTLHLAQLRERAPQIFEEGADPLRIIRQPLSAGQVAAWKPVKAPSAEESPIFVVGFPRSGTTMLETMLDAHPKLASMDERAFIQDVVDEMHRMGFVYPVGLGELDDAQCARLRTTYANLVKTQARVDPNLRLVDKNPLNIMRLPLIVRLFPKAKIILALRHPCDVVLSNFMQTFRAPAYIAMCATIESTAQGYADTFDFWVDQASVLSPDVLELRYEDVVDDIDAQSRRIADFIGIDWDERMVNFHERAKDRGFIGTPSYQQVVEPINRRGVARWEKYREYLEPAIPILRRHIERWNYPV